MGIFTSCLPLPRRASRDEESPRRASTADQETKKTKKTKKSTADQETWKPKNKKTPEFEPEPELWQYSQTDHHDQTILIVGGRSADIKANPEDVGKFKDFRSENNVSSKILDNSRSRNYLCHSAN